MSAYAYEIVDQIAVSEPVAELLALISPIENATNTRHDDAIQVVYDHSFETAVYTAEVSQHLHLSPSDRDGLVLGALLHDVGKAAIPSAILCKPGRLTYDEKAVIALHPVNSTEQIAKAARVDLKSRVPRFTSEQWASAAAIAALHHTYKALTSARYPNFGSLRAMHNTTVVDAPTLLAVKKDGRGELVAVCDVFSALSSSRPYIPSRLEKEGLPNPADVSEPIARISVIEFDVRRELRLSNFGDAALRHLSNFLMNEITD